MNPEEVAPFYSGMKSAFALLVVLGTLGVDAAPQPQPLPMSRLPPTVTATVATETAAETATARMVHAPDLREVLQQYQYHPGSAAAPRQLTPEERAELRRQLIQFGPPPWASEAAPVERKEP